MASGQLWKIVQDWMDRQPIQPNPSRVARKLGVSQSTFDTWKNPTELPKRRNLWAIHELTGAPFKTVVDAAVEACGLYDQDRAKAAAESHRASRAAVTDDVEVRKPRR